MQYTVLRSYFTAKVKKAFVYMDIFGVGELFTMPIVRTAPIVLNDNGNIIYNAQVIIPISLFFFFLFCPRTHYCYYYTNVDGGGGGGGGPIVPAI